VYLPEEGWFIGGISLVALMTRPEAQTVAPSRPDYTRAETINLIKRDGRCGTIRARLLLFFAEDRTKRGCHGRMTMLQMLLIHPVLERIIPDGAQAKPGTAHEALNQLDPLGRPFVHGKDQFLGEWFCHWSLGVRFEPQR